MKLDLDFFLSVQWTVRREVHNDDGEYASLTIDELPGFLVAARDDKELEALYWDALEVFLKSYLDEGSQPPLPGGYPEALARVDDAFARLNATSQEGVGTGERKSTGGALLSLLDIGHHSDLAHA